MERLAAQPSFAEEHARIISACRNKDVHHAQQSLDNALRLEAGAMSGDGDGESAWPRHDGNELLDG